MSKVITDVSKTVTYEVWYGPKKLDEREVRRFVGDNDSDIAQVEKEANDFFKEKEKTMNVSVFMVEEEIKTRRQKLV